MPKNEKCVQNNTSYLIRINCYLLRKRSFEPESCYELCNPGKEYSRIILQHRSTDLALKWHVSNKIICTYVPILFIDGIPTY